MNRTILLTGILFGLMAIVLGAFGAHGLKQLVDANAVESFETGVRYQMYHAFFLIILGIWEGLEPIKRKRIFRLVCIGVLLFSFSIYLLALDSLMTWNVKTIGFVTPIGGLFLIAAWAIFAYYIWSKKSNK
ncbi:DUF423 domain-containing protein [Flagellimonas flava]|uniref:Uncharacterized membrane protein YgdD, TMEM256/DUF423 family n=1 Tax=Flagellimonas flava TaxID=570519 RepID=A0A1M5KCZ1_9FLAO|nr:DUF423 domain-containing protein [Allomuricauda flava]SHG50814.1 Uncharacterized membrane protein YgdD, TMEM256/DUF423 family [Allomuricauda flava]